MSKKDGMYLYNDWIAPFEKLEKAELGELILAMMKYNSRGEKPPRFEGMLAMAADFIFPQMDRSMEYARLGSAGGNASVSKKKKKEENEKKTIDNKSILEEKKKIQDGFERIWNVYPKKVGRQNAYNAFKEISPERDLLEKMISAVCEQKKSHQWLKEDGRYIPNLANWLEGRRWEDEAILSEGESVITEKKHKGSFDTEDFFEAALRRSYGDLYDKNGIGKCALETLMGT